MSRNNRIHGCGAELRTLPKWLASHSAIASAPIKAAAHSRNGGGNSGGKNTCSSTPPIAKLARPQITLTIAEDSPTPRGGLRLDDSELARRFAGC
jgi:hypothetical protein